MDNQLIEKMWQEAKNAGRNVEELLEQSDYTGYLRMADIMLVYAAGYKRDLGPAIVHYVVCDTVVGTMEYVVCNAGDFSKALAIAVHIDGTPMYEDDYDDAEAVMPKTEALRWIP